MELPFTREQFFGTFVAYNESFWPIAVVLWLASAATLIRIHRGVARAWEPWALLAALWLWSGVAYHGAIFTRVNPAAWLFAALFSLQSLLFARLCSADHARAFTAGSRTLRWVGWGLALYALCYPALVLASGHRYPAAPTYGVPCPTVLLTAGLTVLAHPSPAWVAVLVPVAWSVLGSFAAFRLGVVPDVAMVAGAAALIVAVARRRAI